MHRKYTIDARQSWVAPMDTDQFRQFLAVARLGNITRAAEELAISQPALSRSMQRLEEEFGQQLLERKTRAVALTEAGSLLRARAEQVLGILDDTRAQIADDGGSGRVRIGAIPTIAPYLLPRFLSDCRGALPNAELLVQEDTTDQLLGRCKQGEIDLAIVALPIASKHIETQELFAEELLLAMPTGHPLATKKRVTLDDLQPHPFVLLGEAHCLTDSVVAFCRQRSFHPVSVERAIQLATVQELVALGHGVSLIPEMVRRADASSTRVYRSLDGTRPRRSIAMAWNPYRFESRLVAAVKQRLVRHVATGAA